MNLSTFIKKRIRTYRQDRWDFHYDLRHAQEAGLAYKSLISQFPSRIPSSETQRKIKEYAVEVLGSEAFAPWLKVYTAYRGEFLEGWIPDNYFGRVVCPKANGTFRNLGDLKTLSKRILQTDTFPDIAYFIRGTWTNLNGEVLKLAELKDFLFAHHRDVFLKLNSSLQGKGIYKISKDNFDPSNYSKLGDFVVQSPIIQADWFDQIITGSVATIRITTVLPPGEKARTAEKYLRVGFKDCQFITSAKSLRIPIVDDCGTLGKFSFSGNWEIHDSHPDSRFRFEGAQVPEFKKVMETCEKLHQRVGYFAVIGWDVSVDQNGNVKVMEWNTDHPGIKYSEASTGPAFKGLGWENLWKK